MCRHPSASVFDMRGTPVAFSDKPLADFTVTMKLYTGVLMYWGMIFNLNSKDNCICVTFEQVT